MRDDQNHGRIANSKTFLIDRTKGQYCDRSVTVCQEIWIGSLISLLASFTHASTIGFCQRIYERLLHIDVRWCSKGKRSTWSGTLSNDNALLFDVHMSTSDKLIPFLIIWHMYWGLEINDQIGMTHTGYWQIQ